MWQETLNSDSHLYGGNDVGNFNTALPVTEGRLRLRLAANGRWSCSGGPDVVPPDPKDPTRADPRRLSRPRTLQEHLPSGCRTPG